MNRSPLALAVESVYVAMAFGLPLLVMPAFLQDAAELPKLALLAVGTAALFGAGFSRAVFFRSAPFPPVPLTLPAAFLLASAALSTLNSVSGAGSVHAFLYLSSMYVAFSFAPTVFRRDRIVISVFIASALVSIYAMGQYLGVEFLPWESHFKPRVFATLGNPVFLGGFLAAVFPVAFSYWLTAENEETKDLMTLLLAALGIALYLTWTRSSWLAVAVSTSAQLLVLSRSLSGRRIIRANRIWLLTALVVGIIAASLLSSMHILGKPPVPFAERVRDSFDIKGISVRYRLVTAEVCMRLAAQYPLLGAGIGNYASHHPLERLKTKAFRAGSQEYLPSQEAYPHNDHLQVLAEQGVIGLGIWIWFFAVLFRWALARMKTETWFALGIFGMTASAATDALLNFPLHIAPTAWLFFCMAGLLGFSPGEKPSGAGAGLRPRVLASLAVIAACIVLVSLSAAKKFKADHFLSEGDRQFSGENFEMAEHYYSIAVGAAPLNRFANFRLSVALLRAARFEWMGQLVDRSLYYAKIAQAQGLMDENLYKHLGDIYGRKGAYDRAIEALKKAWEINPARPDIANNLAYFLSVREERLDWAEELCMMAIESSPGDPVYLDTLGWVYLKAGRLGLAEKFLQKALAGLPKDSADVSVLNARREVLDHIEQVRRAAAEGKP